MYLGEMECRIAQLTQGSNERDQELDEANQRTMEVVRQLVKFDRATEANNTLQVPTYPLAHIYLLPAVFRPSDTF